VIENQRLKPSDIERVITHVHQGAIDVLGPVTRPATVTAKALRLAAFSGGASPADMSAAVDRLWHIGTEARVGPLLATA
jgi:hypothetical protein